MLRRNNSVQNLEFKLLALQGGWGKHFPLIKKVISWSAGAGGHVDCGVSWQQVGLCGQCRAAEESVKELATQPVLFSCIVCNLIFLMFTIICQFL